MKNWLLLAFTLLFLFLGLVLFYPRTYAHAASSPLPTNKFWNLPTGSRIAYTEIKAKGEAKPYPIIFLHGGPGGFITYQQIEVLGKLANQGYDVYLYDQIGSGNSNRLDNIGEYTVERHKLDLTNIIDTIGAEKVILIGQSWGAILATLYASNHEDQIHKLVLSCPGPLLPFNYDLLDLESPDSLDLKAPLHTNREANEKVSNWRSATTALVARTFLKKLASDKEADAFQTMLNAELQKSTVLDSNKLKPVNDGGGYYVQQMTMYSANYTRDPREALSQNCTPTLVLKGQYDNQPWGFTYEYLKLLENHKLVVIPNAGHALYIDKPDKFIEEISDFLQKD